MDNRPCFIPFDSSDFDEKMNEEEYWLEQNILTNDQVVKEMVKLQRNLHDKQLGLMRCIDEFEVFKNNLLVGQPKSIDKDIISSKFNFQNYTLELTKYFNNSLVRLEEKIASIKR